MFTVQPQQLLPAQNIVAAEFYLKNIIFLPPLPFNICHIDFFFTDFSALQYAMEELFCRTF